MAERITAFKATDGKLFTTEKEANDHDHSLDWSAKVDQFFASGMAPYAKGTYSSMTEKVIIAWEQYKLSIKPKTPLCPPLNLMATAIEVLNMNIRTDNCLRAENIYTLDQLTSRTENDLRKIPNLGIKSIKEIKDKLAAVGLSLAVDLSQYSAYAKATQDLNKAE